MGGALSRSIQEQHKRSRSKSVSRNKRKEAAAAPPLSVVVSRGSSQVDDQLPSGRPSLASNINEDVATAWRPEDAENRRRYHAVETSDYILPSDDPSSHVICPEARKVIKRHGAKVLDVGCANGAWMDTLFSTGHVNCEYYGVDIAPDAFEFGTVCGAKLSVGNVLEKLPCKPQQSFGVGEPTCMPKDKWVHAIKEIIRVTKPGGWIELVEVDSEFYDTGPLSDAIMTPIVTVLDKRGLDVCAGSNLVRNALIAGGLVNIEVKPVSIPLAWNGELGRLHAKDVREVALGLSAFMTKALGISNEEYVAMVDECCLEWGKTRAFMNYHCLYAQKH
ncbi:UNVERIFIED_CONTAM: hypothetical protein HDU68_004180 [Siphonaria sp. JEL0065]|nr:hypothetical protein HDU68_004180 [Siphonaria sp. JEL0065]